MARPLPKDLEKDIAGTAKRAEIRSVGLACLILGTAFGFGLGAAFFSSAGSTFYFIIGAGVVGVAWFLAARARKKKS
ncbi:hypothetical protein [Kordiimonas aestuarii]|uniref:hypothetical protein n=1 Tax=Kordiimonas aestuarii TaxID=1005925 RepID=UPI0021D31F04|nr:hypothetical protein [Kordiimonas aestuarii]